MKATLNKAWFFFSPPSGQIWVKGQKNFALFRGCLLFFLEKIALFRGGLKIAGQHYECGSCSAPHQTDKFTLCCGLRWKRLSIGVPHDWSPSIVVYLALDRSVALGGGIGDI